MSVTYQPFLVCDRCGTAVATPNHSATDSKAREYGAQLGWIKREYERYHGTTDYCPDCKEQK